MVISHRGKGTGEKENTIEAFEKAIQMGAGGIECDARLNSKNEILISHDKVFKSEENNLLTLQELLVFVKKTEISFFIELKTSSLILTEKIVEEVKKNNLWEKVHLIGFSFLVKSALKLQGKYPKLRVMPFVDLPILSFIKLPQKSYGVFLGWIDEWLGSQFLFRTLISENLLKRLKRLYEKNGFKVMAGVINNRDGIEYFKSAEITDIVTDKIDLAAKILG